MIKRAVTCLLALTAAVSPILSAGAGTLFADIDEFEIPEGMQLSRIGESMRINNIETQIYRFQANLEAGAIAKHFAMQWPRQMRRAQAGPWDVLSHRQDQYLVTVQTMNAGRGRTQGFIAASNVFEVTSRNSRPARSDIPLLAGTQVLQDIATKDYGRTSRTRVLISERSAAQNLDWYRNHFRSIGFVPITQNSLRMTTDGGAMVLNRDGEQLNLSVATRAGKTVVTIVRVLP